MIVEGKMQLVLPLDIIQLIYNHISRGSFKVFRQVCRSWNEIALDKSIVIISPPKNCIKFRHISFGKMHNHVTDDLLGAVKYAKYLHLERCINMTEKGLAYLINVTNLMISGYCKSYIPYLSNLHI
jgi:hypothetical protein